MAPTDSEIEHKQFVELKYAKGKVQYLVPIKVPNGDRRGCFMYSFDQNFQASQTISISLADELESCEVIS